MARKTGERNARRDARQESSKFDYQYNPLEEMGGEFCLDVMLAGAVSFS